MFLIADYGARYGIPLKRERMPRSENGIVRSRHTYNNVFFGVVGRLG